MVNHPGGRSPPKINFTFNKVPWRNDFVPKDILKSMFNISMDLNSVSQILQTHQADLDQFAVKTIAIFGSVARGEAEESSDIDLLVEFNRPVGLFEFIRLKNYLENLTGSQVDLVTSDALRPELRESILREAVYVA
jgi:uncharacterized protein